MKSYHTGVVDKFAYSDGNTPDGYVCDECGATGVRLYREYNTFLEHQHLTCRTCTLLSEGEDSLVFLKEHNLPEHNIGSLVAAVPTEDGRTFWGYTSVPPEGVDWWDNLPKE